MEMLHFEQFEDGTLERAVAFANHPSHTASIATIHQATQLGVQAAAVLADRYERRQMPSDIVKRVEADLQAIVCHPLLAHGLVNRAVEPIVSVNYSRGTVRVDWIARLTKDDVAERLAKLSDIKQVFRDLGAPE